MSHPLIEECHSIWMDKWRVDDAELKYHTHHLGDSTDLAQNIQAHQQPSKQAISSSTDNVVTTRLENLELENQELRKVTEDLQAAVKKLASRISALECSEKSSEKPMAKQAEKDEEEDDDDIDLFGSDEEEDDDEAEKLKAERIQAYQEKKSKKTQVIAKSNIILEVKPWEDTTDMEEMEKNIRTIEMDGLLWGTAKLVPVGYGIKKLVISCVVVDDKVSIDDLEEQITAFEDHVQSVDIAAFNKI